MGTPPAGGDAQDARRFRQAHGCAFRKFPSCLRTRARRGRAASGVCFFWLLFFAQAKKSDSRNARKLLHLHLWLLLLSKPKPKQEQIKSFRAVRDLLFFGRPKKSKQKKTAPGQAAPRKRRVRGHTGTFRKAHPCACRKRCASCAPPLRGFTRRARRPSRGTRAETATATAQSTGQQQRKKQRNAIARAVEFLLLWINHELHLHP
jgi:hypothetical protein